MIIKDLQFTQLLNRATLRDVRGGAKYNLQDPIISSNDPAPAPNLVGFLQDTGKFVVQTLGKVT